MKFRGWLVAATLTTLALEANAVPVVFQGLDEGANSLAEAPIAKAASDAFDSATGPLDIIDFDTNTTGAVLSPASQPDTCGFALCGGNTTPGGSNWFGHLSTTTITFDAPIDAFGAYFSGWQQATQTLQYTDGSTVTLNMPSGNLLLGGLLFFGFTDIGASISSITYNTVSGNDPVGIDDMRFGTVVPIPAAVWLFASGLLGMIGIARRKKAA